MAPNSVKKPENSMPSGIGLKIKNNYNPFTENTLDKVEGWTTTANQGTKCINFRTE